MGALKDKGGRPLVRDTDIAEKAGLVQPRNIRQIIKASLAALKELGHLEMRTRPVRIEKTGALRGFEEREVDEYWLNERQALYLVPLVQLLRTPASKEMNKKHSQRPGEALRLFRTGARRGLQPVPKLRHQHHQARWFTHRP